jgi:PTH1 family peptidyl-tRNA hydrolase
MAFLIAGLGNYEKKYEYTRHNIGYLVVDKLLSELKEYERLEKSYGIFFITEWEAKTLYLFKPYCYMNESGGYISKALYYLNLSLVNLIVIHDDKDLPFGTLKIKLGGSSGGHRGVESIINTVGKEFVRFRCGIGSPDIADTAEYVLSSFNNLEKMKLPEFLLHVSEAVFYFIKNGLNRAMSQYNRKKSN